MFSVLVVTLGALVYNISSEFDSDCDEDFRLPWLIEVLFFSCLALSSSPNSLADLAQNSSESLYNCLATSFCS